MDSVLIEYSRFDDVNMGVLTPGKRYILAHQDLPVTEVATGQSQVVLLDKLADCLRYDLVISNADKWKSIVEISDTIKTIFIDLKSFQYDNMQLDVVLNASELCLLPFELLLDENENPYFADSKRVLSITRRFRQANFESAFPWPKIPKVLFVYAHGGGREVPFTDHTYWLEKALEKWGTKDSDTLTVLSEPGFDTFSNTIKASDAAGKPFTHIHILAHGVLIQDPRKPQNFEWGIAFGKKDEPATTAVSVKNLFASLTRKPFLVNYMICDGANFSNPMTAEKNPVQVTHMAGVPIVLGSQFPLSMNGSVLITELLYKNLFNGEDIREILHTIKVKLYEKKEDSHDWISLASYVRLPEGYEDYQFRASLAAQMQQLKFIKKKTETYASTGAISEDDFLDRLADLTSCVKLLEVKLKSIQGQKKYEDEILENLGLLGSSYKRIAELHYLKTRLSNGSQPGAINAQLDALIKSMAFYKSACDRNLTHHWTLVQYLSLDAVLNGQVSNMGYWYAAELSITNFLLRDPLDGWAYGSSIELQLLKVLDGAAADKQAIRDTADRLSSIAKKDFDKNYVIESTIIQISRYLNWWTSANGFKSRSNALIADLDFVQEILKKLSS